MFYHICRLNKKLVFDQNNTFTMKIFQQFKWLNKFLLWQMILNKLVYFLNTKSRIFTS